MEIDFAGVVEHAPDIIFCVDEQGRVTYVNAVVRDLLGYEPSDLLGASYAAYIPPHKIERSGEIWEQLKSGQVLRGQEFAVPHKDGREVHVLFDARPQFDRSGRFIGVYGIVRDVTAAYELRCEREKLLKELRDSEERFRHLVEHLPCVVYVAEPAWPPVFLFISGNVERFTGFKPEEFYADGSIAFQCVHPDDRERAIEQMRRSMYDPAPYVVEFRSVHRRSKRVYHAAFHSLPVADAGGQATLRQGIIMDVTEQKRLEQELLQSQRLAAIGEMAAMMAHEIRNPLAGMSLALRTLRTSGGDKQLEAECLDDLEACLRRIDNTVSRALDFSKARPPMPRPCRLPDILAAARQLTAAYARKSRVDLHAELPAGLPELVADPDQLEQVFVNLILNACKAMPQGGRVTLRAWSDPGRILAEVADTGIGIPPEQLARVFNPFQSGFAEGVGLGLSLSKRILAAHGGAISVESTPGQGTTFRIELPLEPPHAQRPAD